jgi:Holliday junction resolvase
VSNYAKGRRAEYRVQKLLEAVGFDTIRSAGSKGTWDVVAIGVSAVRLIQVKSDVRASKEEREAMKEYRTPAGVTKEIWTFFRRRREPVIEIL